jgi:hypothetical protein
MLSYSELGKSMARMEKYKDDSLFAHQRFPIKWFQENMPRGIYIISEPGSGKTRIFATIAKWSNRSNVIFISPKSLKLVFSDELVKIHDTRDKSNYHYISANAGNIWEQWEKIIEITTEKNLLIIIDEAHGLSQRIANVLNDLYYGNNDESKEKGIYKLYDTLRSLKNVNIIASSGTPIVNDSFEIVPILNILRGEIKDTSGRVGFAFSDRYGSFYRHFIAGTDLNLFSTRIQNMIFWYRIPRGLDNLPIPIIKAKKIVKLKMSEYQWSNYTAAEALEKTMTKDFKKHVEGEPYTDKIGLYHIFTRKATNMAYPPNWSEAKGMAYRLKDEHLKNITKYSVKIGYLMKLLESDNLIRAVFSHFVDDFGIELLEKVLKFNGWKSVLETKCKTIQELIDFDKSSGGKKYYIRLTGKESLNDKATLLRIHNTKENAEKRICRLILFSSAAGHGLTFYSINQGIFLEPVWNPSEEEQIIDRLVRLYSSRFLKDNSIEIHHYIAVDPNGKIETIDEKMKYVLVEKTKKMEKIVHMLPKIAINCPYQFIGENEVSREYISKKKIPPLRSFVECLSCSSDLEFNIDLQAILGTDCDLSTSKYPSKGKIITYNDKQFILDENNGLAWDVTSKKIIEDNELIQILWKKLFS